MRYFLGIDGGGTKTASLLIDEKGEKRASLVREGISYKDYGLERVMATIKESVDSCILQAGIEPAELAGIVIGLPCFGEGGADDPLVEEQIKNMLQPIPCTIVNDVEVGFAGSLGLKPGIHIVSGTGSIAFGKNYDGTIARSGGWSAFFGDEGSCYWLGRRTMELFSKQADLRMPRGPLYQIIMEHFALADPMDFINLMEINYVPNRSKVASLQKILLQAACAGDRSAQTLYAKAAKELSLLVTGIVTQLNMSGKDFPVSYSGGLFHAQEFVIPDLKELVYKAGGSLTEPEFDPVTGAALMAADQFSDADIELIKQNLK